MKRNWENTTVLLTGGAGFLGAHVRRCLEDRGCKNIFIPRSQDYDLVNMEDIRRLYAECQPQVVIHLAAKVGGIGANMGTPGTFFYDNFMMGVQLMDVGRQMGVQKFVSLGTVCSYPMHAPTPFRESDLWNGYPEETNAPYGIAKKMLLVQSQAYRAQYGMNCVHLIPVNLYGPGDNFDLGTSHVIPAIIRKCLEAVHRNQKAITVWGTGQATREFLYVEDAAEAIMLATESYDQGDPVNLGSGQEIAIQELVALISQLTQFEGEVIWDFSKPDGQPRRLLDTARAKHEFGFQSSVDLATGLQRTIDWYQSQTQDYENV